MKVYFDSFLGLIPAVVESCQPGSSNVRIRLTGGRGCRLKSRAEAQVYYRNELLTVHRINVIPRDARRCRNGRYVITADLSSEQYRNLSI